MSASAIARCQSKLLPQRIARGVRKFTRWLREKWSVVDSSVRLYACMDCTVLVYVHVHSMYVYAALLWVWLQKEWVWLQRIIIKSLSHRLVIHTKIISPVRSDFAKVVPIWKLRLSFLHIKNMHYTYMCTCNCTVPLCMYLLLYMCIMSFSCHCSHTQSEAERKIFQVIFETSQAASETVDNFIAKCVLCVCVCVCVCERARERERVCVCTATL